MCLYFKCYVWYAFYDNDITKYVTLKCTEFHIRYVRLRRVVGISQYIAVILTHDIQVRLGSEAYNYYLQLAIDESRMVIFSEVPQWRI